MALGSIVTSGIIHLVAAASFLAVGAALRRRDVAPPERAAAIGFVTWWWALAAYMGITGAVTLAASTGWDSRVGIIAWRIGTAPLLAAAMWGLTYYVVHLVTGRRRLMEPIAAFYAVAGLALIGAFLAQDPAGIRADAWVVDPEYASPWSGPGYSIILAAFGLPPIAASVAYASLIPKLESRAQRYRVALVAASILAWVGGGLAARVSASDFVVFVTLVGFGLAASVTVLAAYFPPRPVAEWLDAAPPRARVGRPDRQKRRDEFAQRCRELL